MRLISLKLRNFKGIREFTLKANGSDVTIFGDNGAGKTTIVDAWTWLLFDKDSHNRTDFEIKTLDESGSPIHNLEHEVEAELELPDGRRVVLRKVYKEKWTKRRGAARAEFTGHTTDYYVDGVPTKKADYDSLIASIADEKLFRLLTDPTYFNVHLHWQERRRILLEVCGDVTEEDVIASDSALAELPKILNGRSIDDLRKIIQSRRTEINKELDRIPVRIDEVRRNLPNIDGIVPEALAADIAKLRAARQEKLEERARIESGGQVAELQRRLAEVQAELATARRRAQEASEESVRTLRSQLADVEAETAAKRRELVRLEGELAGDKGEIRGIQDKLDKLRDEWHRVNALEYDGPPPADVEEACPACGQSLPSGQVEEARKRAQAEYERRLADFNSNKSQRLADITAEGKRLSERVEQLDELVKQRESEIDELANTVHKLEAKSQEIRRQIEQAEAAAPSPDADPEVKRLQAEADRIAGDIETLHNSNAAALAAVDADVVRIDTAIQALEEASARVDAHRRGLKRIEELEDEERRLAAEFEELERQLHLLDEFVRAKVRLLTDRINSRFRIARFKLFEEQVNGGITETCECMVNGVPYNSLNHGARIQAGLDIIQTLGDHYGFRPPIFVDNAESVTDIPQTTAQQIRLVVSAGDRTLRVVTHEPVKEAV